MIGSLLGKTSQFVCFALMGNLVEVPLKDSKKEVSSQSF
jgi:hypothetical protein